MSSAQKVGDQKTAKLSPSDLTQIKLAARELRSSNPQSILADLVEEKIRAIENEYPAPLRTLSSAPGRRIFRWEAAKGDRTV
ncbi:hypothetical protein [Microvirga alba]|uniref:Uncharacterized protein n=1 Tax=Microvirga alba TaxID=2791025 RepID=A0A931BV52_9HYPH|nr:hypothetical protein [Microvirga alba]MBF9235293.1 hypothetical protein [Microvirga alba]